MAGLTDQAGGGHPAGKNKVAQAQEAWQESMTRRTDQLRDQLRTRNLNNLAICTGAQVEENSLRLVYWNRQVTIQWPELTACFLPEKEPCSVFDLGMLLYYLHTADGIEMADQWIGFRDLPHGAFYNQAFQGYSGDLLAQHFCENLDDLHAAARKLDGIQLPALAPAAYAFNPFARIRLAVAFWPGDEDFPSRASVLFDANACHYMTTDGLALLGAGLARRMIRAATPG